LKHPIFHQPHFFKGHDLHDIGMKDLTWINADGSEMTDDAWNTGYAKLLGLMLCGDAMNLFGFKGEPITDGTFLLFLNAHHENITITLPGHANVRWRLRIDTADEAGFVEERVMRAAGSQHALAARSLALFEQEGGTADEARDVRRRSAVSAAVRSASDRLRETFVRRQSSDPGRVV
jgi:glycogen operon protein